MTTLLRGVYTERRRRFVCFSVSCIVGAYANELQVSRYYRMQYTLFLYHK